MIHDERFEGFCSLVDNEHDDCFGSMNGGRTVEKSELKGGLIARDVVVLAGGSSWEVKLGRRDGLRSRASRVAGNLPDPEFNLAQLNTIFARNNLMQFDMIALSGAHTVGFSHCNRFANRIYSFSSFSPVDPSLDPNYAQQLMQSCPPQHCHQHGS
ncbi:Peroxidase 55 [Hibiscus syriacus]|uniref:peroxidase n=1 Tax=Hibiscus syriacus TaxID=106335 RepID=A0A6A2X3N9_HIBSY|nr:Peroxidase 55 [Hibiscus syriacus]